jgi:hypothetical protein
VPATQLVQPVALAPLTVPGAHGVHDVEPGDGATEPAAHATQSAPLVAENVPALQLAQLVAPAPLLEPAAQLAQLEAAPPAAKVPGAQGEQLACPAVDENVPARQKEHAAPLLYVPGGQLCAAAAAASAASERRRAAMMYRANGGARGLIQERGENSERKFFTSTHYFCAKRNLASV